MRRWAVLVLLVASGCGVDQVTPERIGQLREAIVGGRITFKDPEVFMIDGRFPQGAYLCSSTLIGPHTLLTAAHCVVPEGGVEPVIRVTNAPSFTQAPKSSFVDAVGSYPNPAYDAMQFTDDTAVIELAKEPFAPIKQINRAPIEGMIGAPLHITGYGITVQAGNDYGHKRTVESIIRGIEVKKFQLGTGTHGICQGDSGGPAFLTFPDGVERQVGITSTGFEVCGSTGDTDVRVDRYQAFIDGYLDQFEGSCGADGRCRPGCATPDPDCACFDDGVCNSACADPAKDPDCPSSCGADGVCSKAACATPDPDCASFGAPCGRDGHCAGRACITSPQHDQPYCSSVCDSAHACPSGYECSSGVCRYPLRPEAKLGAECEFGSWCGDDGVVCALYGTQTKPRCVHRCFEQKDCYGAETCSVAFKDGSEGVCAPTINLTKLTVETWPSAGGCTAVPGEWVWALVALLLARRRR